MDPIFKINDEAFPVITANSMELGDAVLVEAVVGQKFQDWVKRLDSADTGDVIAIMGLASIAVQRVHAKWSVSDVVAFMRTVPMGGIEVEGGNDTPGPPAGSDEEKDSPSSSDESISTPAPSEEPVPV